MEEIL